MNFSRIVPAVVLVSLLLPARPAGAETLEQRLQQESPEAIAVEARDQGDAKRGAIVFHQPQMACAKCHTPGDIADSAAPLGPNLAVWTEVPTDAHLVDSVLSPSKSIRKGFEPLTLVTKAGTTVTGLLVEDTADHVTLRDPSTSRLLRIAADDVDDRAVAKTSVMPVGQINQLASRQQFLDLIRYLIDIRDGGPARARELQPPPALFALQLPEYESHVDHAGLIRGLNNESFRRGEAIYKRLCINCHGDHNGPGSLPTAPRFGEGRFKNGHDPFAMYQTLTRGFGFMVPQSWMVPQQKYDVVHYIRIEYLHRKNPSQFFEVTDAYLQGLPPGDTRGPEPTVIEPWVNMDYGPSLVNTYEIGSDGSNFAYKGIAVRLDPGAGGVSRGNAWMIFDHDTFRVAAAWTADPSKSEERFIDWNGIQFNGMHQVHPRIVGQVQFANPTGPGWADPETGSFADDQRVLGRDDRRYGPLPAEWARFRGIYADGDKTIISYTVGTTEVLEMPGLIESTPILGTPQEPAPTVFTRSFHLGPRDRELTLLVATHPDARVQLAAAHGLVRFSSPSSDSVVHAGLSNQVPGARWRADGARLLLTLPPGEIPLQFFLWTTSRTGAAATFEPPLFDDPAPDLSQYTRGGPSRWPEQLTTTPAIGDDAGPFAVDVLTPPDNNPWLAQLRLTGLDFFDDPDRMAVCSWDGDVWLVRGLSQLPNNADTVGANVLPSPPQPTHIAIRRSCGGEGTGVRGSANTSNAAPSPQPFPPTTSPSQGKSNSGERECPLSVNTTRAATRSLTWRRIASGLFQPLGLKIVRGDVYVTCRDQIVVLRDLNSDGETDFYDCFNNDQQVTDHFHEFAMGLQVDDRGNFYYAKSARHALPAVVPQHGTLLRVTPDGSRTDIIATGFRAANGVCLNPDGTFVVTDQEGHWNPKNRINWVREGGFYGNMFGYHNVTDPSDSAMEQPLCWITNAFDRSPAELLWATSDRWGPLKGSLLNLSYGYGKVYVVPFEDVGGLKQGGMCELPIPQFPTGIIRGRFHPVDGQLYLCGMYSWAGNQQQPGGLYRLRATGRPSWLPIGLSATKTGLSITFTDPLSRAAAVDPGNYHIKVWSLKRTANYGSEHFDEHALAVTAATLSDDGRTVTLAVPEIAPTWCIEVRCRWRTEEGAEFERLIHGTVHRLGAD